MSPIYLASCRIEANPSLMAAHQSYSKNLVLDLCRTARGKGVLSLWKGRGYYSTAWSMTLNMGMLASYDRSVGYFKEISSLKDSNAQPCKNLYAKTRCNVFYSIH